jgi:hypothetical protein
MKLSKNKLLVICFCILCCFSTIKICFADRTIVLPDGERIVYGGSMGDEVAVNGGFFRSETFVHFLLTNENNFNPCDREDDYESGFNDGRQSCIDNPVSCGINVK